MPRRIRASAGGLVYHVLNRGAGRMRLFRKAADFAAVEQVLKEAVERTNTRLLANCLMSNHWHLLWWPREDGELREFLNAGCSGYVAKPVSQAILREVLSPYVTLD